MKGVRFYEDGNGNVKHRGWAKSFPQGTQGLALFIENKLPEPGVFECVSSVFDGTPGDGPYASGSACVDYLRNECRRISEQEARKRFPKLFDWIHED